MLLFCRRRLFVFCDAEIFPLSTVFGALGSQYFSDRFGRRRTFIVAAAIFILGVIIMSTAQSFGVLMFGRFFVGLGVGTGLAVSLPRSFRMIGSFVASAHQLLSRFAV